jgi:hypothetical protein
MGAFDQSEDQSAGMANKAKNAMKNKRNKSAGADSPEPMERGIGRDGQGQRSPFEDQARERRDSQSDDQDNWA